VERAARQPGQLAVVPVVEDREELAVAGEVVGEADARERVGDRVRREARLALLAVGDDRLARRLQAVDGVLRRRVLRRDELRVLDAALVVGGVGVLQRHGPGQRPDELGGDGHGDPSSSGRCGQTCLTPVRRP
jgi:hypothetical protein